MLNYYELLKVVGLENMDAVTAIRESFNADFRREYSKIQINKTTRKNAIIAYSKHDNFMQDNEMQGLYCDGVSILNTTGEPIITTTKRADIKKFVSESLPNRKPVDLHIKETIAIARAMGWTPGATNKEKPYYIEIDDNYYNFTLVYNLFTCIADNSNKYYPVKVELCTDKEPGRNMLFLSSKYGCAFILPFNAGVNGVYSANNVNFNYYMETENEIDNYIVMQAKKSA